MSSLIVKKGGLIVEKDWKYDENIDKGDYVYEYISTDCTDAFLLSLLQLNIDLEEGFLVRDWFNLLINYPIYQKLDLFIPSFLDEYNKCKIKECINDNKLTEIVFQKIIFSENYEPEKNKLYECEIYIDIFATGPEKNINYGIGLKSIKEYLDLPMRLANGMICKTINILREVKNIEENEKISRTINISKEIKNLEQNDDIFKYSVDTHDHLTEEVRVNYNLFDFITSFIYEISFYGTPEKRDMRQKELMQIRDDVTSEKIETVILDFDKLINNKSETVKE